MVNTYSYLVNKPAATITDVEVEGFVSEVSDSRVKVLEAAGRDNTGRPMIRFEAEGLYAGIFSIGRVIAMLRGTDKAPRRVEPEVSRPAAAVSPFFRKTDARQMTNGELDWIDETDGSHPHVSLSEALSEMGRRERLGIDVDAPEPVHQRVPKVHRDGFVGSEKQIAWSKTLKPVLIARVKNASVAHQHLGAKNALIEHLARKKSAKFFIDTRRRFVGAPKKEIVDVLLARGLSAKEAGQFLVSISV